MCLSLQSPYSLWSTSAAECGNLWTRRDWIASQLQDVAEPWRADLLDIGLLTAETTAKTAPAMNR